MVAKGKGKGYYDEWGYDKGYDKGGKGWWDKGGKGDGGKGKGKSSGKSSKGGWQERPGKKFKGRVTQFDRGWGFLACADFPREVFCHQHNLNVSGFRELFPKQMVWFECETLPDGRFNAVNVTVIEGGMNAVRNHSPSSSSRSRSYRRSPARKSRGELVMTDVVGRCTRFEEKKGFGFIECDDVDGVVFCHNTEIRMDGFRVLHEGDTVTMDVEKLSDGRYTAKDVRMKRPYR